MRPKIRPLSRIHLASLCLAALFLPGSLALAQDKSAPKTTEPAAYLQISALKPRKDDAELLRLAPAFLEKYPDSLHYEAVASLAAEALMRKKDWKGALDSYVRLAGRFPKSPHLDQIKFKEAVCRMELKELDAAVQLLENFGKEYPASKLKEDATHKLAVAYFLKNDYQKTLLHCRAYLNAYPEGRFAGDIVYRLAVIDFHDPNDQSDSIIKFLGDFIAKKPADPAVGAMHCLLGDTWLKQKPKAADPLAATKETLTNEAKALEHFRKAALSPTTDAETAERGFKGAERLLTSYGEAKALGEFRAAYRKQVEVRKAAELK